MGVMLDGLTAANRAIYNFLFSLSHSSLKKKIGQVIRSMDRGTDASDTVVTYLFLYLVPVSPFLCLSD